MKKLSKKQIDKLLWYYKDGVRIADDLSIGQREVIEDIRIYENMDSDIDEKLQFFKEKNY